MTIEELELDPSSRFCDRPKLLGPYQELIDPLWVGKWKCKGCEVWVDGEPKELCGYCESTTIDEGTELPRHVFKRVENGKIIYCTMSEDGRVVDLDDYDQG